MSRVGIIYYSRTGNTEKMARAVYEGVKSEGVEVELKKVEETKTLAIGKPMKPNFKTKGTVRSH